MRINADTEEELQEAIDDHVKRGWELVNRSPVHDGTWCAILKQTVMPPAAKIYRCGLCGLRTVDKEEICTESYDLVNCPHADALIGFIEE